LSKTTNNAAKSADPSAHRSNDDVIRLMDSVESGKESTASGLMLVGSGGGNKMLVGIIANEAQPSYWLSFTNSLLMAFDKGIAEMFYQSK
jgi:hypothetical protein